MQNCDKEIIKILKMKYAYWNKFYADRDNFFYFRKERHMHKFISNLIIIFERLIFLSRLSYNI